tara:strand:- start:2264 stop:3355 length:1092 start_codon:yes stop_codon:yes gene_type:complete
MHRAFPVAVVVVSVFISLLGCVSNPTYTTLSDIESDKRLTDEEFQALAAQVAALNDRFNVLRRADHALYFDYAEELVRRGRYDDALDTFKTGLRINALDLDAQVRAAELEIANGDLVSAYERLTLVAERSDENPSRQEYARHLIEAEHLAERYELTPIPDRPDLTLQIQPIGDVPPRILYAISARIEEVFRVTTVIVPTLDMPPSIRTRDDLTHRANRVIEDIEANNPERVLQDFYAAVGVHGSSPVTDSEKRAVLHALVLQQEDGERVRDDLNYLFALTQTGSSIMSTARLYNESRDTIDTGIHRGVVQAMSSYVQLLGLTRSSTMPCATAYPHSLAEFDLKSDRLCEETRVQIASAYGKLQ